MAPLVLMHEYPRLHQEIFCFQIGNLATIKQAYTRRLC